MPNMLGGKELDLKHNDKETINRIILENTQGSKYYENEKRKEALLHKRTEARRKEVQALKAEDLSHALVKADAILAGLEKDRDLKRTVVHVDMDAFFASVEILSKPHLADVPMAVGSDHMLSTANYAARSYGVRSGMPGFIARKLCACLTILPPNFEEYERISALVDPVLAQFNSHFNKVGIDEAYIDITHLVQQRLKVARGGGDNDDDEDDADDDDVGVRERVSEEIVKEMREGITQATSLTASAGIAPNGMLAKVCSDMRKPNGQFSVAGSREAVMAFLKDLPVRKINGIGRVSEEMLKAEGVESCGDLIDRRAYLYLLNSAHSFEYLMRVGLGLGFDGQEERSASDEDKPSRKSMSVERTFESTRDLDELLEICDELCQCLSQDLAQEKLYARCLTLKLKTDAFQVTSRSSRFACATMACSLLQESACRLLRRQMAKGEGGLRIREDMQQWRRHHTGVRASDLARGGKHQTSIADLFKVAQARKRRSIVQQEEKQHTRQQLILQHSTTQKQPTSQQHQQPTQHEHNEIDLQAHTKSLYDAFKSSERFGGDDDGGGGDDACWEEDGDDYDGGRESDDDGCGGGCCSKRFKLDGGAMEIVEEERCHQVHSSEESFISFQENISCDASATEVSVVDDDDLLGNREGDLKEYSTLESNHGSKQDAACGNSNNNRDTANNNYEPHHTANNETFDCPVCHLPMPASDNLLLNQHIDECLNMAFLNHHHHPSTS